MSQEFTCRLFRSNLQFSSIYCGIPTLFYLGNSKLPSIAYIGKYCSDSNQSFNSSNTKVLKKKKLSKICQQLFLKPFKGNLKKKDPDNVKSDVKRITQEEIMEELDGNVKRKHTVGRQLKVMNYNVLAQDLIELHKHLYINHSPKYLTWNHRSKLLMEQITTYLPDILTLQEVQESHIGPFYKQLEKFGYRGLFKRRTGNKTDGCALYYMSSLLELVDYRTIEFYRPHINPILLNRPNVAIIARFRSSSTSGGPGILGRELIVANTHLLYSPRRTDVRLAQIQILLAEIHKMTKNIESQQPAVMLMGDLNSWPDSPVIKLLEEGRIASNYNLSPGSCISNQCTYVKINNNYYKGEQRENVDLNGDICGSNKYYKKAEHSQLDISHNFDFNSVYNSKNQNKHSLATTYQGKWIIVDYIFYSKNIKLMSRLKLPTVEECEYEIGSIPNKVSPSDHFPLAATFLIE